MSYGVHLRTLFVIGIGYVASAAGLWRMGWRFRSGGAPSEVVISLRLIAIGLVGLLLTPFSIGGVVNWAHMGFGVMIALTQFWLTAMLLERRHSIAGVVGASLQLGGGVMAALSLPDWSFVYLFQGEVLMELALACAWCSGYMHLASTENGSWEGRGAPTVVDKPLQLSKERRDTMSLLHPNKKMITQTFPCQVCGKDGVAVINRAHVECQKQLDEALAQMSLR